MEKIKSVIEKIKVFFSDTIAEMRKCEWPGKRELMESTTIVIISLLILAFVVWICDTVLLLIVKNVMRS